MAWDGNSPLEAKSIVSGNFLDPAVVSSLIASRIGAVNAMKSKHLITLILTLALAAANAAPLSAVVTCGMGGGSAAEGCCCVPETCCPDEAPAGPGLGSQYCTVSLPDAAPVETAPAPTVLTDLEGDASLPVALPGINDPRINPSFTPGDATTPLPEESPPRYALFCAYLI